jgi:N-acetylglucosaminyldiphosphoundecaprenol N-acetyl-beta-D-mannosaminyltransferase
MINIRKIGGKSMKKIEIMGLPFDNVTLREAVSLSFEFINLGKQALAVTPNAEIAELCLEKGEVKSAVLSAEIVLPDGEGVLWAAKKLGTPLKEKVAGVDFGFECARRAAEEGKSIFLLGGKEGVAEKAAEKLISLFPRLKIAGTQSGYFSREGEENTTVIKRINESRADILFVCLGAPAQEIWAANNRTSLSAPKLIACLGGSIDVYAGNAKRAPKAFIKMRAEWLWRIIREPKRIIRAAALPKFIISVYKYKRKIKKTRNIK